MRTMNNLTTNYYVFDFGAMLGLLWFILPALLAVSLIKSRWIKGRLGELIVSTSLKYILDKNAYRIINNITLPTKNGTTQVDHVVVSRFGVFVIETKFMKGWIFGSEHQASWTQRIYKKSYQFQNPLHQNRKHVKVLQELLKIEDNQIHSLVVFVGGAELKTDMPENVRQGNSWLYIVSKTEVVLSDEQLTRFVTKIDKNRLPRGFRTDRAHVKHVKEIIEHKKSATLCPRCKSTMILRTAKKGANAGNQFWGCTTYPKCWGKRPSAAVTAPPIAQNTTPQSG